MISTKNTSIVELVVIYNQIFEGLITGWPLSRDRRNEAIHGAARSRRQGAHPAAGAKGEATSLGGCKKKDRNTPEVRRLPELCEKMDEIHVNFLAKVYSIFLAFKKLPFGLERNHEN